MLIGIDASSIIKPKRTGVDWYAFNIIRELIKIVPASHCLRLYTPRPLPADFTPLPSHWEERILHWPFRHGWTLIRLSSELRESPPDVFFSPDHIIPPFVSCKTVVTIHDLGFRDFPHAYAHPRLMNFLHARDVKLAHEVIAPSQTTKDAIINAYKVHADKIHVILHGCDADLYHPYHDAEIQQILSKYNIKKPYVISVGRLEEKKNTRGVLRLVQAIRVHNSPPPKKSEDGGGGVIAPELSLVLVGSRGYGYEKIKRWIEQNNASNWIHELGWLPSSDTAKLISGASALIALSRAEGFGLTILEALACHTPVLCSDIPAHREIGKDLVTYTDPDNLAESTNRLIQIINKFNKLINSINTSTYSWPHSAQQTLVSLIRF